MRTVQDGDHPPTGIGDKVPPKPPTQPDDERHWKPIPGRPGYKRHAISGDVRKVPA